jgi:hypothetical protein
MMRGSMRLLSMMSGSMRLLSMMRNDEREHRLLSMMSLIFRCRHYDENRQAVAEPHRPLGVPWHPQRPKIFFFFPKN